jgi:oligoendopeptidase F
MSYSAAIEQRPRHFLPASFVISDWESLAPYFAELEKRSLESVSELEQWLRDASELEAIISEDVCWRQIKMTCDTENKDLEESFNYFMLELQPRIQPWSDKLNRKLLASPFIDKLPAAQYETFLRNIRKQIDLYREINIPIQSEISVLQQQFGVIAGKMTVVVQGQEYTLQQAAKFLEDEDRSLREQVYLQIAERRYQDREALDQLFDQLLQKRNQLALNADMQNYREYRFLELGRFDYDHVMCEQFHQAVKEEVMPLINEIYAKKKERLGLTTLRPWDIEAEPIGTKPLRPFADATELTEKSIDCLRRLHPFFGDCIATMRRMQRLDLESRKGKAPGGYNCPLAETGAPFIFMNAAGTLDDVTTMVHEGGHAVHSFLTHPLPLNGFKEYPTEIAEVASMSMELFTMDYWDSFFSDPAEWQRAKEQQLERVITIFPWIATIDKFQHWIYTHPQHSKEERNRVWLSILNEYSAPVVDFSGLDKYRSYQWQRQLHLFEVPFYYIEYGIAQLGAIGLWQQYHQDPHQALDNYIKALSLGGTKTLPELFAAAGLPFDFSAARIRTLMQFVQACWKQVGDTPAQA